MKRNKIFFFSILFICSAWVSVNAQELFMTSIAPMSEVAGSIPADFKIRPRSATTSSFQPGGEITKAFDNNYSTMYHSNWNTTQFPVTLQFNFPEENLDYLVYYPRTSGSNGFFQELEIWYTSGADNTRTKIGDFNFYGSSSASRVAFGQTLMGVKSIEFIVKSGVSNLASCAEMEFYRNNPERMTGSEVFADNLMTVLKPGVTLEDIDQMDNAFYRELAMSIYRGNYSLEYRVGEHFPYLDRTSMMERYMVNAYDMYENPTGIYFPEGKNVIIVDNIEMGRAVSLVIPNYLGGSPDDWSLQSRSYPLQNGVNVIDVVDWGGIGYISYYTSDWETAPSIQVHVPQGIVQGYFDAAKHDDEDFARILANANAYPYLDVLGEHIHLAYTVDAYRKYTQGQAEKLLADYDTMISWQQRYMGFEKYANRGIPKNRIHSRENRSYFMYKDNTGVSFEQGTMNILASPTVFFQNNWGPCHEVGHVHQFQFNRWAGMGEVTVNLPNIVFERQVLGPKRMSKADFQNAYNSIVKTGIPYLKYENGDGPIDVTAGRLVVFYQLYYYFLEQGNPDFFPDINEALRNTPDDTSGWGNADYQLNWVKRACETAELNLIPFFEKWGMLYYTDADGHEEFYVGDYTGDIYRLPKAKVEALKSYVQAQGYPEPVEDISLIGGPDGSGIRLTP